MHTLFSTRPDAAYVPLQLSFRVVPLRPTDTKQELVTAAAQAFGLGARAGNYTLALWDEHKKNTEARLLCARRHCALTVTCPGAREGAVRALAERCVAQRGQV